MYIYPDNLTAKPMMWLWTLRDLTISGITVLVGFIMAVELYFTAILVLGATYAFLTIRFEDVRILDFMKQAACFCFGQKRYDWALPPMGR